MSQFKGDIYWCHYGRIMYAQNNREKTMRLWRLAAAPQKNIGDALDRDVHELSETAKLPFAF